MKRPLPRRAVQARRDGLEKIIEVELTADERAALEKSAEAVREPMRAVDQLVSVAIGEPTRRACSSFWRVDVGKKIVMAITG